MSSPQTANAPYQISGDGSRSNHDDAWSNWPASVVTLQNNSRKVEVFHLKNVWFCRWTRLEEERVQAEDRKKSQAEKEVAGDNSKAEARTCLEGLASRNQIFNMKEAFAMLSKELSDMMRDRVRSLSCLALICLAKHSDMMEIG